MVFWGIKENKQGDMRETLFGLGMTRQKWERLQGCITDGG